MKNFFLISTFVIVLILSISSFASNCADVSLEKAQVAYDQVMEASTVGLANTQDLYMAEKNVLEIKLCINIYDTDTFLSLIKNVLAREKLIIEQARIGLATDADVAFVQTERDGLAHFCKNAYLKQLQDREHVGLISKPALEQTRKACSILKTYSPYQ